MERSESSRSGGAAAAIIVVATMVLVLLPLLYVASIGPVIWLADRGLIGTDEV